MHEKQDHQTIETMSIGSQWTLRDWGLSGNTIKVQKVDRRAGTVATSDGRQRSYEDFIAEYVAVDTLRRPGPGS